MASTSDMLQSSEMLQSSVTVMPSSSSTSSASSATAMASNSSISSASSVTVMPSSSSSSSAAFDQLLHRAKTIGHVIYGYARRLWGVKLMVLCTLIYASLYCSIYSNEDSMICTSKFLVMHWVSYYMCWASIFKIVGVALVYKFVRILTFNIIVVAVFSSALTMVVTVTCMASSTISYIKLIYRFVRR